MIQMFKYPDVTFLTSYVFDNLKEQLNLGSHLIKAKKSEANLSEQYNFYFILNLVMSNFQALNNCRLGLKDILRV